MSGGPAVPRAAPAPRESWGAGKPGASTIPEDCLLSGTRLSLASSAWPGYEGLPARRPLGRQPKLGSGDERVIVRFYWLPVFSEASGASARSRCLRYPASKPCQALPVQRSRQESNLRSRLRRPVPYPLAHESMQRVWRESNPHKPSSVDWCTIRCATDPCTSSVPQLGIEPRPPIYQTGTRTVKLLRRLTFPNFRRHFSYAICLLT